MAQPPEQRNTLGTCHFKTPRVVLRKQCTFNQKSVLPAFQEKHQARTSRLLRQTITANNKFRYFHYQNETELCIQNLFLISIKSWAPSFVLGQRLDFTALVYLNSIGIIIWRINKLAKRNLEVLRSCKNDTPTGYLWITTIQREQYMNTG